MTWATPTQQDADQHCWATPMQQGMAGTTHCTPGPQPRRQPMECQRELASRWQRNQNGPGFACYSCYNNFGTGKKAADPKQTAITQFFKKQKQ